MCHVRFQPEKSRAAQRKCSSIDRPLNLHAISGVCLGECDYSLFLDYVCQLSDPFSIGYYKRCNSSQSSPKTFSIGGRPIASRHTFKIPRSCPVSLFGVSLSFPYWRFRDLKSSALGRGYQLCYNQNKPRYDPGCC